MITDGKYSVLSVRARGPFVVMRVEESTVMMELGTLISINLAYGLAPRDGIILATVIRIENGTVTGYKITGFDSPWIECSVQCTLLKEDDL